MYTGRPSDLLRTGAFSIPIRSCSEVPCARGCTLLWGDEIRGPVRGLDRGGGLGTEAAAEGGEGDCCDDRSAFEASRGGNGCDDLSKFEATLCI